MENFTDIALSKKTLDIYYIRTAIFRSLKEASSLFTGSLLDIGCGKMPYKDYLLSNSKISNYVGLDIETAITYDTNVKPDYVWDGITMPFKDTSFQCAFGTEVLEHCPDPELVLKEVYRVLKPGGVFFFTVPFLWNLHETPHDEYRYTPFSMERHLVNAGFSTPEIKAMGGWNASMAQMIGLWVKRGPMPKKKRKWLLKIALPVVKYLLARDQKQVEFKNGQMITGLSGVAIKPLNNQ